jgi:hypothetical protein
MWTVMVLNVNELDNNHHQAGKGICLTFSQQLFHIYAMSVEVQIVQNHFFL